MNFNSDKHAIICKILKPGYLRLCGCVVCWVIFPLQCVSAACIISIPDFRCPQGFWQNKKCFNPATCGSSDTCLVTQSGSDVDDYADGSLGGWAIPHYFVKTCNGHHLEFNWTECQWQCKGNSRSCNELGREWNTSSSNVYNIDISTASILGNASFNTLLYPDPAAAVLYTYTVSGCSIKKDNVSNSSAHCTGTVNCNAQSVNGNVKDGFFVKYGNCTFSCGSCYTGWKINSAGTACDTCDTANHFVSYNNNSCVCASGYEGTNCATIKDHFVCNGNNCVCDTGYKLENDSDEDPRNDTCVFDTGAEYEDNTGQFNLGTNNCRDNWWEN